MYFISFKTKALRTMYADKTKLFLADWVYHLGILHVAENAISSGLNKSAVIFPLDKESGGGRLLALVYLLNDAQVPTLSPFAYWVSSSC